MIRRLSVLILSTGLGLALVLAPTATSAEDEPQPNPVDTIIKQVQDLVAPKNVQTADHADAPDPPAEDDDIPTNETENPVGPDHGSTRGIEAFLAGTSLLGLNHDNATINDDDSAVADSTLLSLGGTKILGTNADSTGGAGPGPGTNEDTFNPLGPLCAGTGGALCADVLYSESRATNDGTTSTSQARSGVLNACLGGTDTDQTNGCDGLVGAGALESEANAQRDLATGETTADATYTAADPCISVAASAEDCLVGATALYSHGDANSGDGGGDGTANRNSFVAGLAVGGGDPNADPLITEPTDLSIPDGCTGALVLECLFLNQGETYLGPGLAGTAQDALKLAVLNIIPVPGTPGVTIPVLGVNVGHTETLVHNDGRDPDGDDPDGDDPDGDEPDGDDPDGDDPDGDDPDGDDPDGDDPDGDDPDGDDPDGDDPDGDDADEDEDADEDADNDADDDRALPGTGGPSSALLAIGMLGIGLGAGTIAYGRRPRKTGAN